MRGRRRGAATLALVLASGCAARTAFTPPTGSGTPDPGAAQEFADGTARCASVATFTAEAALAGRIGGTRVRGRLHLGVTRDGFIRIEGVAPFGPPVFTLAGSAESATLYLPRDARVLRDAPPADIVDALAGVKLTPGDILAVATACLGGGRLIERAEQFGPGIRRVVTAGGIEVWWRQSAGSFQPLAATTGDVHVVYERADAAGPTVVRLRRAAGGGAAVDLRLTFAQRERGVGLGPEAFRLDVPDTAQPLTLDALRQSGLLGR